MRYLLLAILLLAFAQVTSSEAPPPCQQQGRYNLVVVVRSPEEIQRMYNQLSIDKGEVHEFHTTGPDGADVLVVPPLRGPHDSERMYFWGHGLAHVVCGRFHGNSPG